MTARCPSPQLTYCAVTENLTVADKHCILVPVPVVPRSVYSAVSVITADFMITTDSELRCLREAK